MRYINLTKLRLPDGWLDRAATARSAVMGGAKLGDYANVWQELKRDLATLFHGKCWYCEMPEVRSDNAVDHFRPKGRVSDAASEHAGYRWLAFDLSNLRYACTYCNSKRKDIANATKGGKADRFPLLNEIQRVYTQGSVDDERPALLDPCALEDWKLLGCKQENGNPCAASNDPEQRKRAEISIEIYHLHHEPTCKLRHERALKLLSDIEDAKIWYNMMHSGSTQQRAFQKAVDSILNAIDRESAFSGDMRFLLSGKRDPEHPWIQGLLET